MESVFSRLNRNIVNLFDDFASIAVLKSLILLLSFHGTWDGHKQVGSPMEIREPLSVYKYLCFDHLGGVFLTIFFIVSIPALMYFSVIGRSCCPYTCSMVQNK